MDAQSEAALNRRVIEEAARIDAACRLLGVEETYEFEPAFVEAQTSDWKLATVKEAVELRDDLLIALATNPARER